MGSVGLVLRSHGARLGVVASHDSVLEGLEGNLPFGCRIESRSVELPEAWAAPLDGIFRLEDAVAVGHTAASDAHRLYRDGELLESSSDLVEIHGRLESELHFAVASHARTALFVHAGVVGWKGCAILIPGRSMAGKTTLVRALLEAGATYYSDEYAVVGAKGEVHPYPRPLGVRLPDRQSVKVPPESLGCPIGSRPLPVGLIVSTRFDPCAEFDPEVMGPARGLMALIENTLIVRERSSFALDHLELAARGAVTLEGPRGDAAAATERILTLDLWGP